MNKSMVVGIVAGIGIAVAGGVAAISIMGNSTDVADPMAVEETTDVSSPVAAAPQGTESVAVAAAEPVSAKAY